MHITRSHLHSLGLAALMAWAIPAFAQDVQDLVEAEVEVQQPIENRYRIGLDCDPSGPALKSHLRLDADTGLTVNMVLPNSPAAVAGIRQYDVIVEANGHAVGTVMDLVREVNDAQDKEMDVRLIREGEEHLVKVTPEERDETEIQRLRDGFQRQLGQDLPGFGAMQPEWEELLKRFPQMSQFGNGAFRRINPGFALPPMPNIPNNFNLRIERHNDRIIVQRGNDRYEVTMDTLDELPDDIRPMVENMLNGGNFQLRGLFAPGGAVMPPGLPANPPAAPARPNQRQLEDRFDGLELQLKQLQDAIKKFEED